MPIIPTVKIVTAEFMAPYYMGRRIKLEIIRLENGSFAVDRFLSGSINPWNQIAHENGFPTLAGALAGASRTIRSFAAGPVEISSPLIALRIDIFGLGWTLTDRGDGSNIADYKTFSESIRIALQIAGGIPI